ncbi:RING finger family protein [Zostera marina]|uniref:RING-type E3 ubiquitin transferase n=1 Tax=Zostera marina TaxID=29655 RepID=A0A0K9PWE8_ZOSMR|nr:RING finger family protein [Zostera marina]
MSCSSPNPPAFCSDKSPELKLYQAFIFSVPVFFTFILLFLFYLFYLRRRRANWASIRMRISYQAGGDLPTTVSEPGLKKEVREMLPVVVFNESFLIRETQCSVCLGDYKSDDRLKRIPPCGHTFHVECIDNWLTTNITCPLCRASLIPTVKTPPPPSTSTSPSPSLSLSLSIADDIEIPTIGEQTPPVEGGESSNQMVMDKTQIIHR